MKVRGRDERRELLRDAEYFCGVLIERLVRLAQLDDVRHWRAAVVLVRRVRDLVARQLDQAKALAR